MLKLNNPAGRFQQILERARKEDRGANAAQIWARLLGVAVGERSQLFYLLGRVMALPTRLKELVEREPNIDHSVYLRWMPQIEAALSNQHLNGQFATFMDQIDNTTLYGIEICSDLLSRRCPEQLLDEPELQALSEEISDLIRAVYQSGLDIELKEAILEHLYALQLAIKEYPITGSAALRRAFEATLGSVVTSPKPFEKTQKTPEGKRFWKILGRILLILSIPATAFQLGESVIKLLPQLTAVEEETVKMKTPTAAGCVNPSDGETSSDD